MAAESTAPTNTRPEPASAHATTSMFESEHPGCFMLRDLAEPTVLQTGAQPCDERTVPASTFKVPHALIALDTGVVTDPEALVIWDGTKYPHMKAWERDHNLRTAIYESVVWFFQGTAREIGRDRMREYLQAFEYGNAEVDGAIDRFWLGDGSLEISPEESLRFMAALYGDGLSRGGEHLPALHAMLVRPPESFRGRIADGATVPAVDPAMIFSAKTGTGSHGGGSVTWIVGHVRCPERALVFASRVIADTAPGRISPAVTHGLAVLDDLGVLRCEPASP